MNLSPGNYHIFVVTDRRGEVADSDRLDNILMSTEVLEVFPALASSHDPDHSIAVGRTLSAYTTADLVGNELTITYTAYNLTDGYANDVLLRTTLAAGVSLVSSTTRPQQTGQELIWNLGTLTP